MKCPVCTKGDFRASQTRMNKRLGCTVRKRTCNNKECNYTIYTVEINKETYQKDHEFMLTLTKALDKYNEVKNLISIASES